MPTQGALRALKMEAFGWPEDKKDITPVFNVRRCTHGQWHGVFQQKDKATCGPLAVRMALIEMGLVGADGIDASTAGQMIVRWGIGRMEGGKAVGVGWTDDTLQNAI